MLDSNSFSILVVDDERSNLDVLTHILKPYYTVQVAKNGAAALKRAQELQPDIILLDIVMPDMDGYKVLAELKADDNTRHIPVIFITGLNNAQDEERGFQLGAVDYITKPFHPSIVKARVRTHLRIVKHMRTIEKMCLMDALTEIPNRRAFTQRMEIDWNRAVAEEIPLSLLIIDVDKFKTFNDTYGHPQGDVVLQSLAQSLSTGLRRSSDLVARLGGEEFGVLLPGTALPDAVTIADALRQRIEAMSIPSLDNGPELSVTISIGASCFPACGAEQMSELITQADDALYAAKAAGRNRVIAFDPATFAEKSNPATGNAEQVS